MATGVACLLFTAALAQAPPSHPPVIDAVSYAGNTRIGAAQLARGSQLLPGLAISKPLVKAELERVTGLYRQIGRDIAVSPDIAHPADGHVTVTVRIDESGKGGDAGAAGAPPAPRGSGVRPTAMAPAHLSPPGVPPPPQGPTHPN